MENPTKVIFIWHMHQPLYKLAGRKDYFLAWSRLHAVKDYYGMARIVDKFDKIKATFNFSGVLLGQILDYAAHKAKDYAYIVSAKKPSFLTEKEKSFIVDNFFSVNFERFIRPIKQYSRLYQKKVSASGHKKFSNKDILNLQVLFNLCWFHPYTIEEDKNLAKLFRKKEYNEDDKKYVLAKQYAVIEEIIPLYKKMFSQKKIEISITPYMHPIMPLIYDTDILNEFEGANKPEERFSYPQDCRWHLNKAKKAFFDIFGQNPAGSWPSEGSVSEDVLEVYKKEGFRWVATDEAILLKSLTSEFVNYDTVKGQRFLIYKPYSFEGVNIFFRDRNLSDAISFLYHSWDDSVFAANDLLEHFRRIHYANKEKLPQRAVTIVMDGENAWEYYPYNGINFLETVYAALEKSAILATSTPSEFLKKCKAKPLSKLKPGSWINGDFGVWSGSKENNANWALLKRLRSLIEKKKKTLDKKAYEEVMRAFYVIEGSDWNWWNTFEDINGHFKKIFLSYVARIYKLLGAKVPKEIKNA